MIFLVLFLILGLAFWTTTAYFNSGSKNKEIKSSVDSILASAKEISVQTPKLFWLLLKDVIDNSNYDSSKVTTDVDVITDDIEKKVETTSANDNLHKTELDDSVDNELASFSPEVVQLIQEEEEKAA